MTTSYNEDIKKYGELYAPYTKEEIEEMKETVVMIPIRFKRLLATIEQLQKEDKKLQEIADAWIGIETSEEGTTDDFYNAVQDILSDY